MRARTKGMIFTSSYPWRRASLAAYLARNARRLSERNRRENNEKEFWLG